MSYVLAPKKQIEVLRHLVEGNSISGTSRLTGVHRDTCNRLMVRFGQACKNFLAQEMRDLELPHIQVDELWTYCRKKKAKVTGEEPDLAEIGEFYLFVALDEKSRLIPAMRLDRRNEAATFDFMIELKGCLKIPKPHASDAHGYKDGGYKPVTRISTDAWASYPAAVNYAFGPYAEHGVLKKSVNKDGVSMSKKIYKGDFEEKMITTSLIERSNGTARTFVKRLMRRTNAFSKKLENLRAAVAVQMTHYNYCWRIKTLKTTPAVAAGIAGKQMSLIDLYMHFKDRWPELLLIEEAGKVG